jgi:hypothetical protein
MKEHEIKINIIEDCKQWGYDEPCISLEHEVISALIPVSKLSLHILRLEIKSMRRKIDEIYLMRRRMG